MMIPLFGSGHLHIKVHWRPKRSSDKPVPTIDQMLDSLKKEVLAGRASLRIARGLREADPVVLQTAPTFFGLTHDGSLEISQMYAAKLYDTTANAITMKSLLSAAGKLAGSFKNARPQDIAAAVLRARRQIATLKVPLESIRKRRNEALAHLDPNSVVNPQALSTAAKLTIPDLEKVFDVTEKIILEIASFYDETGGELKFIGGDDYKMALEYIANAKDAQADAYEAEHNEPAPFARPRSRPKPAGNRLL
jgi:AbiU2